MRYSSQKFYIANMKNYGFIIPVLVLAFTLSCSMLLLTVSPITAMSAPGGTIKVLYPNGGETLKINSTVRIKWTSSGINGNVVVVLYKKGIKHSVIARQTPNNGFFQWKLRKNIPEGNDFRVRIRSVQDLSVNDFSDRNFTIKK
jgi:hypothetical protein